MELWILVDMKYEYVYTCMQSTIKTHEQKKKKKKKTKKNK